MQDLIGTSAFLSVVIASKITDNIMCMLQCMCRL